MALDPGTAKRAEGAARAEINRALEGLAGVVASAFDDLEPGPDEDCINTHNPIAHIHCVYCVAHDEGQWCCTDHEHEVFADLCRHIADRVADHTSTELAVVRAIVDGAITQCDLGAKIAEHYGRQLP